MEADVRFMVARKGRILTRSAIFLAALLFSLAGWETVAAQAADSAAEPSAQLPPPRAPHGADSAGVAVPGKTVIEVGEFKATVSELTAEFAFLPPGQIIRVHTDDSAARTFALDYYGSLLFHHHAEEYGLYTRNPGLKEAIAAESRRAIGLAYIRDMGKEEYKPTDVEVEQFYAIHKDRLCQKPARYRLARLGVVIGKKASDAEREAAVGRLAAMQKRLEAGDAFSTVADEDSDLEGREPGGVVGWLSAQDLQMAAGQEAITDLAVGERTEPIITPRGQEIFSMLEREEASIQSFEECKEVVFNSLVRQFNRDLRLRRMDEIAIESGASMNIDGVIEAVRALPRPKNP